MLNHNIERNLPENHKLFYLIHNDWYQNSAYYSSIANFLHSD